MTLDVAQPWALLLLPLAWLPMMRAAGAPLPHPWFELLPRDRLSGVLGWLVRVAAVMAIAATVLGVAGPYQRERAIERIGQGAQIVVVLDRSASMDQPFFTPRAGPGPHPLGGGPRRESKAIIARRLLAEFVAGRGEDSLALILFSAFPMHVLDFTQRYDAIEAAIAASRLGRGLGDTDIGAALEAAAALYADRPYSASRVVLLVSDGGAHLDPATGERIRGLFRRHRIALYWIYLRSYRSAGLMAGRELAPDVAATVPEHALHEFFRALPTPYRAYQAEDPAALKRAIADVARLERYPITYEEVVPRRDLSHVPYGVALAGTVVLLGAAAFGFRRWT